MNSSRTAFVAAALALAILGFALPSPLTAQALPGVVTAQVSPRVTQQINDRERTLLAGHVRPFLKLATDEGEVDGNTATMPLMLVFTRTAEQQATLDSLADALHNRNSPQFHRWLTPAQFGARFSPADSDIAQVRNWLESKGFKVLDVPPSKTFISFTGSIGQLKTAFGVSVTEINSTGATLTNYTPAAATAPVAIAVNPH